MVPAFVIQACTLGLFGFLAALPFSIAPPLYRIVVPLVTSLGTVALFVDAVVYRLVGFHINGFFFRVLVQPGALTETGVPHWQAALMAVAGIALVELALFPRFARLLDGAPRRVWTIALTLLLVATVERFAVATLAFWGGSGVFATGQVMPLQAPLRMNSFLAKVTGRKHDEIPDPFSGAVKEGAARLPAGLAASEVNFTRSPDVLFVIAESLRSDFFDEKTMPRLSARARDGAVFERHYSTAPATFYSIFSLLFGLQAHKADAVLGSGRPPILFGALKRHDYQIHLVSASSVDWMGLKDGVFGEVKDELETDLEGPYAGRDTEMMERARRWVDGTNPDKPVFLFLFFFGTHYDYTYPERSAVFTPAWDGKGSIKATTEPPLNIKNRARNAAHEIDWKLEEFLSWYEAKRGRRPILLFTGDHGEEFRERGRIGHGSDVTNEQIHVPMVVTGENVPRGRFTAPTSHTDLIPSLFQLLGDTNPPEFYSDGVPLWASPKDRFVLATVGWEPTYAAIGEDSKVRFAALDKFGRVQITDPKDQPLPDGAARFPQLAPKILQMMGKDPGKTAAR
jgi:hypothetical protein